MTTTFHLTDGTTIPNVTTYATVRRENASGIDFLTWLDMVGPVYTVFADDGHRYVTVESVARIESAPAERAPSWYDLPMAAGMWAADGADLGA